MESYLIPAQPIIYSEEIKKSRFITYLAHTAHIEEAKTFIQQIKQLHPTARHHCWAYIAGEPDNFQVLGLSDDGEPAGTAGRPMLSQLQGNGLGEITAVVVRYFGGILLGTGGLVKAYGGGVQQALKQLPTELKTITKEYRLHCDYTYLTLLEALFQQNNIQITQINYTENVELIITIPESKLEYINNRLADISRGTIRLISVNNE